MMDEENAVGQIEQLLDLAFGALNAGDVLALAVHAQAVLVAVQSLVGPSFSGASSASWEACSRRVQMLRHAITRHQAFNERMLQQLVPAFQEPTYGGAGASGRPNTPYAGVARASGRLEQVLRA